MTDEAEHLLVRRHKGKRFGFRRGGRLGVTFSIRSYTLGWVDHLGSAAFFMLMVAGGYVAGSMIGDAMMAAGLFYTGVAVDRAVTEYRAESVSPEEAADD